MMNLQRAGASLLLLGLAALSSGCTKRQILAFDDHQNHALTTLQAFKTTSYVFWSDYEHEFYFCNDTGDKLVCKRSCGGTTDLTCPKAIDTGYNSTNVR